MKQAFYHRGRFWAAGCALLAVGWLADAAVDAWFDRQGLLVNIFSPDLHEILIRVIFLAIQLLFLWFLAKLLRESGELRENLTKALDQAETERNKSQAILEAMGDGISIQDPELRIVYQNAAHRQRMGGHLGEFCYRAYQKLDEVCPGCHLVQSFTDGQVHVREATASPKGELRHFEIVSTPLFDPSGKLIAGIEAVRDITERKQVEEDLRSVAADLQQRTQELQVLNSELETFSYSLSHDLRSYLARISLAAEALQVSDGEKLEPEGAYCLRSIRDACEGMEHLVSAMLDLARITRKELQAEDVDLSALATEICQELSLAEPERILRFTVAPGLRAHGDAQLLRVVLENLLGNACKYTRPEAEVCITVSASDKDGHLVFAVADNGIGFDMREAGKLFLPFERLSSARGSPGAGIGLTSIQRIIERHGGRVWAESAPGAGATFFFTLAAG